MVVPKDQADCVRSLGFLVMGYITSGANLMILSCDLSLVAGVLYLMFLVHPFNLVSNTGIYILISLIDGVVCGLA